MTDKYSGIDFDRSSMTRAPEQPLRPVVRLGGILFTLLIIAGLAFIAYKVVQQMNGESAGGGSDSDNLTEINNRLSEIETRLEKLETIRRSVGVVRHDQPQSEVDPPVRRPAGRTLYQVTPSPENRVGSSGSKDPATEQRLSGLQQGLGAVQTGQTADREALQATTDKLADIAGQMGAQSVQILQNQDELNQLLSQNEREAVPFELTRGSNPVPIGPISFILRTSNPKTQRYSLCIYLRPSCIELKDKTQNEVVQFVISRNTTPLELVATKILKDQIVGYLEIPRNPAAR